MDEYEIARREREADEARFTMGGALQADHAHHDRMQRALENAAAAQNAAAAHQSMLCAHLGGILGAFRAPFFDWRRKT